MFARRHLTAVLCGAAILGCDEEVSNPITAPAPNFASANTPVAKVTGHAAVPIGTTVIDRYSFVAIQRADGSFDGEFQWKREFLLTGVTLTSHGDIVCFLITGNRVRLAARLERSEFATFNPATGNVYADWDVEDNGEGSNDPDDRGSFVFGPEPEATARLNCAAGFNNQRVPSGQGNIQIHN